MAQLLKLQVVPAPVDEALRGRVGLNVKTIKELQISVGDPVLVRSARNSEDGGEPIAAAAWPSNSAGKNQIEIDHIARLNGLFALGDEVEVIKLSSQEYTSPKIIDARRLSFRATHQMEQTEFLVNLFIQQTLMGRYVTVGATVPVTMYGKTHNFICIDSEPQIDASGPSKSLLRVTTTTKIVWTKAKLSETSNQASERTLDSSYDDVGGLADQIRLLKELIELPLSQPQLFTDYGIRPPRGVLLYGPPGTGKTLLASAVARATGSKCFQLGATDVVSKFYGDSEAKLRDVFEQARQQAPSIIFIDELDAIAPKRDSSDSEVTKRVVGSLLALMDGIDSKPTSGSNSDRVVVLAATNRPNSLDPALRRPGRFDREIEVPIPNERSRKEILQVYLKKMPNSLADSDISHIASITHGYVGADLSNLCKEAAMFALKRNFAVGATVDSSGREKLELVTHADFLAAMADIRPSAMREILVDIPKVKWEDIGGYEEVKQRLKEAVEWPIAHPEVFRRLGIDPPRGVLLYGPPGCSKTLLAKALATQAGLNFIPIKGPELFSKYVGESERAVREVFRKARQASPAIVFFDELDAIGVERGNDGGGNSVQDRVLAQMLNELDGIEPLKSVLFLAATNRPDIIDKALMRPGRIDRVIFVGPPDVEARKQIFRIQLRRIPHNAESIDLEQLAAQSDGLTGAEITSVCREACLAAMKESMDVEYVEMRHFVGAIMKLSTRTVTKEMLEFFENFQRQSTTRVA